MRKIKICFLNPAAEMWKCHHDCSIYKFFFLDTLKHENLPLKSKLAVATWTHISRTFCVFFTSRPAARLCFRRGNICISRLTSPQTSQHRAPSHSQHFSDSLHFGQQRASFAFIRSWRALPHSDREREERTGKALCAAGRVKTWKISSKETATLSLF